MKTFIEEYGIIIVVAIAILALVTIATLVSGMLGEEIQSIVDNFTEYFSTSYVPGID